MILTPLQQAFLVRWREEETIVLTVCDAGLGDRGDGPHPDDGQQELLGWKILLTASLLYIEHHWHGVAGCHGAGLSTGDH